MENEPTDVARMSLRLFGATIAALVLGESAPFGLLVGPGDSGAAMLRLTALVYELLRQPQPPAVAIPLVRYKTQDNPCEGNRFDNRVLLSGLQSQLAVVPSAVSQVLFVDDEVEEGMAVKATVELLSQAVNAPAAGRPVTVMVVAEDHGFRGLAPEYAATLGIDLQFRPFRRGDQNVYHVLPRLVPPEVQRAIEQALEPEPVSPKECFNLLLGAPTKHLVAGKPEFSSHDNELVRQRVPGFAAMERSFAAEVREALGQGIRFPSGHRSLGV